MASLRRVFLTRVGPDLFGAAVIQPVLTVVGVFTFLAGALYLPTLGPTRVEMILVLLLLACVALLCTAVGQLAAVVERLEARGGKNGGGQPVAKKGDISSAQLVLAVLGVIAWVVAGLFATGEPVRTVERSSGVAAAPNNLSAAGVLGFALAGGLCFLGFGLAGRRDGGPAGPPRE